MDAFRAVSDTSKSLHLTIVTANGLAENAYARKAQNVLVLGCGLLKRSTDSELTTNHYSPWTRSNTAYNPNATLYYNFTGEYGDGTSYRAR